MYNVRKVVDDLYWVGANDHRTHLFENIHPIPDGVSYNAYLLLDEKTVLFDTVDWSACRQLLENIEYLLDGRDLDYLVVNHLEPDHAASMGAVLERYPNATVISTEKGFYFASQFGFHIENKITVESGDTFSSGKHDFAFVEIPMVHWPEPMVTLDTTNGVLFSADAFGTFKALDGILFADEPDFDRDWLDEARRYYTNIVGKYGPHVQQTLKTAAQLPIKVLAPLHGPVWRKDLGYILDKYDKWSSYTPEETGLVIVYASMYGNTEAMAQYLASRVVELGQPNVRVFDVSNTHISYLISEVFKYSHIALASCTYNLGIYPRMKDFIADMQALNLQNRTFAILENGTWAPSAGDKMREMIDEMRNMYYVDADATIVSTMNETTKPDVDDVAEALVESMKKRDSSAK